MAAWEGEGCSAVPAGLQECSAVAAGAGLALVVCRFSVRGVCVTRRVSNDLTTTPCGEVRPGVCAATTFGSRTLHSLGQSGSSAPSGAEVELAHELPNCGLCGPSAAGVFLCLVSQFYFRPQAGLANRPGLYLALALGCASLLAIASMSLVERRRLVHLIGGSGQQERAIRSTFLIEITLHWYFTLCIVAGLGVQVF